MAGNEPRSAARSREAAVASVAEEAGDLVGQGQGLGRVVADLHEQEQVGPAHDPEADAAEARVVRSIWGSG